MKCLLVITTAEESTIGKPAFDSRNAALDHMRERVANGEQFTFELYEQVLEGGTTVKLETRPATERCTSATE